MDHASLSFILEKARGTAPDAVLIVFDKTHCFLDDIVEVAWAQGYDKRDIKDTWRTANP